MKSVVRIIAAATSLVLLPLFAAVAVEPPDNIEYDIVRYQDSLTVWLNLSRYFGDDEFEFLANGIDYAVTCKIELNRPKKLFGTEKIEEKSATFRLSHRLATREFALSGPVGDSLRTLGTFLSPEETAAFLNDSILISLEEMDSLRSDRYYEIHIDITRISLTSLNLATTGEPPDNSKSPIKYLFRQFLHITSYGRDEYSTVSRSFSLREIYSIR